MAKLKNILIGLTITTGLVGLGAWLFRLKKASVEIEVLSKISLHKVTLSGVTLRVDTKLQNPSSASLTLRFPFVRIYHSENLIGSSEAKNNTITVPANGEVTLEPIFIQSPMTSLLSFGAEFIQKLKAKSQLTLVVKTTTQLLLGKASIPFSTTENIKLS
jgi:LEA14-like dessication related protein